MNINAINAFAGTAENTGNTTSVPLGLAGAAAGAIVVGLVYGVVSLFIGEHSYIALLIGAASGGAALFLGRGRSMIVGAAAAVLTLVGVFAGKLIIGAPPGVSWVAYHTTPFDILFCYVLSPAAALVIVGPSKLAALRRYLPI